MRDDDLRGLVALFHESEGWVTAEHLEVYVDQVFAGKADGPNEELPYEELKANSPLGQSTAAHPTGRERAASSNNNRSWSDSAPPLYAGLEHVLRGVDPNSSGPGLDAIRDRAQGRTLLPLVQKHLDRLVCCLKYCPTHI